VPDRNITFRSGGLTLAGTLTEPRGTDRGPGVLLVVGSGPIDRNSDLKRIPLGITRIVADHLAAAGIASLRFDKRGIGQSEGDYRSSGFKDNVADAAAGLEFLRSLPTVDPEAAFVVGHSEGALIATAIAAGEAPPAGAVLLAGTAQTGEEVLRAQARRLPGMLPRPIQRLNKLLRVDVEKSQIRRVEKLKASTDDVVRMQGLVKVNARWFREFMAFDPAEALAQAGVPILAITGAEDQQVEPGDIDLMRRAAGPLFEGHVIPGVNHILRTGGASPTTYRKQTDLPVDPRILDLLTDWIHNVSRAQRSGTETSDA
jgi:hypothetical protein